MHRHTRHYFLLLALLVSLMTSGCEVPTESPDPANADAPLTAEEIEAAREQIAESESASTLLSSPSCPVEHSDLRFHPLPGFPGGVAAIGSNHCLATSAGMSLETTTRAWFAIRDDIVLGATVSVDNVAFSSERAGSSRQLKNATGYTVVDGEVVSGVISPEEWSAWVISAIESQNRSAGFPFAAAPAPAAVRTVDGGDLEPQLGVSVHRLETEDGSEPAALSPTNTTCPEQTLDWEVGIGPENILDQECPEHVASSMTTLAGDLLGEAEASNCAFEAQFDSTPPDDAYYCLPHYEPAGPTPYRLYLPLFHPQTMDCSSDELTRCDRAVYIRETDGVPDLVAVGGFDAEDNPKNWSQAVQVIDGAIYADQVDSMPAQTRTYFEAGNTVVSAIFPTHPPETFVATDYFRPASEPAHLEIGSGPDDDYCHPGTSGLGYMLIEVSGSCAPGDDPAERGAFFEETLRPLFEQAVEESQLVCGVTCACAPCPEVDGEPGRCLDTRIAASEYSIFTYPLCFYPNRDEPIIP